MTDPTFETQEDLDAFVGELAIGALKRFVDGSFTIKQIDTVKAINARVRAAHSHLKGNDDEK